MTERKKRTKREASELRTARAETQYRERIDALNRWFAHSGRTPADLIADVERTGSGRPIPGTLPRSQSRAS